MNPICVVSRFHPVGQGLFFSGHFCSGGVRRFSYVFDCGTISSRKYLDDEISNFKDHLRNDPIDLACLSHFDADHMNGMRQLLTECGAKVLVMPYIRLADRIVLAIESEAAGPYLQFLVDPVTFMQGGERGAEEVILVEGGADYPDDPPPDDDNGDESSDGESNEEYSFEPSLPEGEEVSETDVPLLSDSTKMARARISSHDQPVTLRGLWEFVFYNEQRPGLPLAQFESAILALIAECRDSSNSVLSDEFLPRARRIYEDTFGKGGRNANRISLVMYSAPLKRRQIRRWRQYYAAELEHHLRHCLEGNISWFFDRNVHYSGNQISGLLLTGDIYFAQNTEVQNTKKHFGSRRWNRIETLQVPHHGSSKSWHAGAGSLFQHRISVFSSKAGNRKHPGKMVMNDLASTWLVRVNENAPFSVVGWV